MNVSSPNPPISKSFPSPPFSILFEEFPVILSLPNPPIAFSIIVPEEIIRFPLRPPISELYKVLEFFSEDLKSITWSLEKPLKSKVSFPEPSAIVKAVESIHLDNSEKIWLVEIEILVLKP